MSTKFRDARAYHKQPPTATLFCPYEGEGGDRACGLCGMVATSVRSGLGFFQNTNLAFVHGLEHAKTTAPRSSLPGLGEVGVIVR